MSTPSISSGSTGLVVVDLDNTLYDWVTYFATAFYAMVDVLVDIVPAEREILLDEFRAVHQAHANSEHPFALLEVPTIARRFEGWTKTKILDELKPATDAFSAARNAHLRLYDGVRETLEALEDRGVPVVGHTEAVTANAFFRLEALGIRRYLKRLYALDGKLAPHPRGASRYGDPPPDFITVVDAAERKPNPQLLLDICRRHEVTPGSAVYVGDSLTRDVAMANRAGVVSVWARYGTIYDRDHWQRLVRVTHWTQADVDREQQLRSDSGNVRPAHTIDRFSELLTIVDA